MRMHPMDTQIFDARLTSLARRAGLLLIASMLCACTMKTQVGLERRSSFGPPPADNPEPLQKGPQAIAATLAKGGYVIYLRHGRTQYDQIDLERSNRDNGTLDLARCETQRQLSDDGRREMKQAGEQFRLANIPLDKSFSSRYCRARESAAFFVDAAQATEMLSGEAEVGKDPAQKARTVAFFSQRPADGKNIFMMAHGGIFWEATGFVIPEGNAVVLDPKNLKVIVARINAHEWGAVAQANQR